MRRILSLSLVASFGALLAEEPARPDETPRADDVPVSLFSDVNVVDDHQWVEAVSRRKQRVATAPQAVVVLDENDLRDTPAVNLPDRLRYVPGVDVYQSRAGQYDVGLRGWNGLNNPRIIALVDDRDLRWTAFGAVRWRGVINASDISRVEIAKGPSSVTYGANAFGGVISIQTRQPDDQHRVYAVASLSGDGHEADTTALGPIGRDFYYKVTAGGTWLDDLDGTRGYTTYQPNARTADTGDHDLISRRSGAVLGWRFADHCRAEVYGDVISMPVWEFVEDLDVGSNAVDWDIHDGGARVVTPWFGLSYLRQSSNLDYSNQKAFYAPPDFRYAQAGFDDTEDVLRLSVTPEPQPRNQNLVLGAEYSHLGSDSNLWAHNGRFDDHATWGHASTSNRAVFAEDQWAFAPHWIGTGGVRVDDHSQAGTNVSPRVALNLVPDDSQFWLLSYSRGYRLPNLVESSIQDYYFRSDPDLRAETVQAAELGWHGRSDDFGVSLGCNGFWSRSNDQVWIQPLAESEMQANYNAWLATGPNLTKQPGPYFAFTNLDNPVDVWGAESDAAWAVPDSPFTLWGNGTWQIYRHRDSIRYRSGGFTDAFANTIFRFDRDLGREINGPPRLKGTFGITWRHQSAFATIATRIVAGRDVFSVANSDFPNGEIDVQHIPAYATLDLTVGFMQNQDPGRFVRLSVLDLLDQGHYEWYHATSADLVGAREQQLSSELGLTVTVQAGWTL